LGYRKRARLFVTQKGRNAKIGFYRQGTRQVEPLNSCPVLTNGINLAIKRLKEATPYAPQIIKGLKHILFEEDMVQNTFVTLDYREKIHISLLRHVEALCNILEVHYKIRDTRILFYKGSDRICFYKDESLAPEGLFCPPSSFFQANLEQNKILVKEVVKMVQKAGGDNIVDLFCGSGNFSIPLARMGFKVTGVEIDDQAIDAAKKNALLNRCHEKTNFLTANLFQKGLDCLSIKKADTMLMDPPRVGAKKICKELDIVRPKNIVYVSCDPMTLARDIASLMKKGYGLEILKPVDMFPQTFHTETIALLRAG